jgi:hypothetical protein
MKPIACWKSVSLILWVSRFGFITISYATDEILHNAKQATQNPFQVQEHSTRVTCQVLLFSATVPPFVASTAKKYMKPDRESVDTVGKSINQTSEGYDYLLCIRLFFLFMPP